MARQVAIETSGLAESCGAPRDLDRLDLSVPAGRAFALLDPNRAGKPDTGF